MYKLIALDLDGTLLNDNKTISKENIEAITRAKDLGIKVVLCTGRPIEGINNCLKELSLINSDDYCITCSGAMIQNTFSKQAILATSLSLSEAKYLYKLAESLCLDVNFYINNKYIAFNSNLYTKFEAEVNNVPYEIASIDSLKEGDLILKGTLVNEQKSSFKGYPKFFNLDTSNYSSMKFKENVDSELFSSIDKLPKDLLENFSVLKTSNFSLEILNIHANKGTAVKSLCAKLNIPLSQVICVGDSGNDEHMIRYAGLGVAMGNASESIKSIADYITKTNEENGVAHVINKFILRDKTVPCLC